MTANRNAWNTAQLDALRAEHERIGALPGGQWPTPRHRMSPDKHLELLREVPDGSGIAGYLAALERVRGR